MRRKSAHLAGKLAASEESKPHRATVAGGFVAGLLSGMKERGLDIRPPLRAAGIDAAALRDRRERVPLATYAALYDAVIHELHDEGFGLFDEPLRPGSFEFLCRGVATADHLELALMRAARFLSLVLPDLEVDVSRDHKTALLIIREAKKVRPEPCRVFAFEWLLRLLHALSSWLVASDIEIESVRFPFARPAHVADYARVFSRRCTFGADQLEARMRADVLDLPIRRDERALEAFLAGGPGNITMLYRPDRETVRRMRQMMEGALPERLSLEVLARRLGLSERTLHRRLHDEGSSFRDVSHALHRDVALRQLTKTDMSIAAIAAHLGYAEPSAFFRAFRHWTGEAPTRYRKRGR